MMVTILALGESLSIPSTFFWWEIVTLMQRLILTGWVLLIPIEFDAWRIFLGLLTTIGCD